MRAILRTHEREHGPERLHTLADRAATIGRNDDNNVVLASAEVSRYHARINWTGTEYVFEDLHSTNGSLLNDEPVTAPCALKDGDVLRLGDCRLTFSIEGAETLRAGPEAEAPPPSGLTRREIEVLRLIANGRTNREIAADLVLSERTVARHITNIYGKIDARGKAEATAFALKHRLT